MSANTNSSPTGHNGQSDNPWLKLRQADNVLQTQQSNTELIDHTRLMAMSAVRTILAGGHPIPASLSPVDIAACNRLISELIQLEVAQWTK